MAEEPAAVLDLEGLIKHMDFPPSYYRQINSLQTAQLSPRSETPSCSDGKKPSTESRSSRLKLRRKKKPSLDETIHQPTPESQIPSAPRYRLLRLWKMKPGRRFFLEPMAGRDAILKHGGRMTRTPLPPSCPLPPSTGEKFYLQTEAGRAGDPHRITVKWIPVAS